MANLFQPSIQRAIDGNGNPVSGAKLFFYLTDTLTFTAIYADRDGTTNQTNPVIADSTGLFPPVYIDKDTTYRVVQKSADEASEYYDIDPVPGFDESSATDSAIIALAAQAAAEAGKVGAEAAQAASEASATAAATSASDADTDADRSELAANAAATSANLYADTAAGITATSSGDFFLVVGSGDVYATLYKNVSGTATAQGLTLPSTAALPDIVNGGTKNLFDKAAITAAYEIYYDGSLNPQADSDVSDFIAVMGMDNLVISGLPDNAGANRYGAFYATDKTTVVGTVLLIADGANFASVAVPSGAKWFRYSPRSRFASTPSGYLDAAQVESGDIATEYESYRARVRYIDDVTLEAPVLEVMGDVNLFDGNNLVAGTEVYGDGSLSAQANSVTSHYIRCEGQSFITVSGLQDNPGANRYYRFLDADKAYITSSVGLISDGDNGKTITVPTGAVWFQFSPRQRYSAANDFSTAQVEAGPGASAYQVFSAILYSINGVPVKTGASSAGSSDLVAGRNYLIFGDSITETTNVDSGDYEYGTGYRANWPDYALPLLTPQTTFTYAKAGAHFTSFSSPTTFQMFEKQIDQAIADARSPNVIIVSLGTNDWGNSASSGGGAVVIGDYSSTMAKALGSLDLSISMDAMRKGLHRLQDQWPDAVKFVLTPLQRADFTPDEMATWLEDIRKMAKRYGCEVIDCFTESGIVYDFEVDGGAGDDLSDGIHPDASGQQKQGLLIAGKIRARFG